tara:strand:- start:131 stop:586 length:456 start_codon:yes stop_codon:yes gene_type:complete
MIFYLSLLICANLIDQLKEGVYLPRGYIERVHICASIYREASITGIEPSIPLAIGWLESRFTNKEGRAIKTPRGRIVRAEGPLQVLRIYHCKRGIDCDLIRAGVSLLHRLIERYGLLHGLAYYAGGHLNNKSLRYARYARSMIKKIRRILN